MNTFRKRCYSGIGDFLKDISFFLRHFRRIRKLMKGQMLSPDFRERLMLAVTRVNDCRHCIRFHKKLALEEGLQENEIQAFLSGEYENCPDEQLPAILYAEQWAQKGGSADEDQEKELTSIYGEETAAAIGLTLRTIRLGNLAGNSFDAFLFKISGGRRGV
ncbi:MAG: carboxymuconolactone decarboxylase family protein [Candidatus Hydrogenedens sp.]|jgi:AhpD family alkylhydroperoxidase|nr:carboxymuconolactone decarboxylase family protein [Candidatus Hydrogenedens sp.]